MAHSIIKGRKSSEKLDQITRCTYKPPLGALERDCPVAVHGGLQELARPEVPEEQHPHAGADGQQVALEGHGPDAAAVVAGGDLLDGLEVDDECESQFHSDLCLLACNVLASSRSVFAFDPTAYMCASSSVARQTFSMLCGSFLDMTWKQLNVHQ